MRRQRAESCRLNSGEVERRPAAGNALDRQSARQIGAVPAERGAHCDLARRVDKVKLFEHKVRREQAVAHRVVPVLRNRIRVRLFPIKSSQIQPNPKPKQSVRSAKEMCKKKRLKRSAYLAESGRAGKVGRHAHAAEARPEHQIPARMPRIIPGTLNCGH